MATYRNVQMSFWTDSKVSDDFTPEDKYFYLYLFTNPHTNLCGCYEVSLKLIAYETGYSKETIERLIERFEKYHKVVCYSKKTKEVLILNWYKYNWTKSEKFLSGLDRSILDVKDEQFRHYLTEVRQGKHTVSIPYTDGMDTTLPLPVTDSVTFTVSDMDTGADKLPVEELDSTEDSCVENLDMAEDSGSVMNPDKAPLRPYRKSGKMVYYPNDEKLNQAFADYVDMRKQIRAKMTDKAIALAMNNLKRLSTDPASGIMDNDLAIRILEQSIMNSWKGLFELKENAGFYPEKQRAGQRSQIDALLESIRRDEEG